MSGVSSFFSKSPEERRVIVLTLLTAPLVKLLLRFRGYATTSRLLDMRARAAVAAAPAERMARLAHRVIDRLPFEFSCLERSLVVWWLVGGADAATVRFGVAPGDQGERPEFHAWVEVEGTPLHDGTEDVAVFLPFSSPEPPQPDRFD